MAKFFITNNLQWYKALKENISNTEFKLSFDYSSEDVYALGVHKLNIVNQNAIREQNDFCIVTGTCIYKKSLDVLPILHDYKNDIAAIRNSALGQYAISAFKKGNISVFTDPIGAYDVYYYNANDGGYIISSSLYEMAQVIRDNITLDEMALLERTIYRCIFGGRSFFNEIKRLRGDECIKIENGSVVVKNIKVEWPCGTENNFELNVRNAAVVLKENIRIANKVLGVPSIYVTGGLDSRLVLASCLANSIKPKLITITGHSQICFLPYSNQQDIKVAEGYAKRYGLEFVTPDCSSPEPIDKDWENLISNHGFPAAYFWGTTNVLKKTQTNLAHPLHLLGLGGELLRVNLLKESTKGAKEFGDRLAHKVFDVDVAERVEPSFSEHMDKLVEDEFMYYGIDTINASEDEMFPIDVAYRAQANTQSQAFCNHINYAYNPLLEYNVLKYRVSRNMANNAKFQIAVTYQLYPDIFELPIWSGNQHKVLNRKTKLLESPSYVSDTLYNSRISNFIRTISPVGLKKKILRPIKHFIYRFSGKNINNAAMSGFVYPKFKLKEQKYNILDEAFIERENANLWSVFHKTLQMLDF